MRQYTASIQQKKPLVTTQGDEKRTENAVMEREQGRTKRRARRQEMQSTLARLLPCMHAPPSRKKKACERRLPLVFTESYDMRKEQKEIWKMERKREKKRNERKGKKENKTKIPLHFFLLQHKNPIRSSRK